MADGTRDKITEGWALGDEEGTVDGIEEGAIDGANDGRVLGSGVGSNVCILFS